MRDTVRVIQANKRRVKIFVDFWNVVVNARNQSKMFDLEVRWDALADFVLNKTRSGYTDETTGEMAGCYVFGSYPKSNHKEYKFIKRTIDEF